MTDRQVAAAKRGLRTLVAVLIATTASLIAGEVGADLLGTHQELTVAVLTPLLMALDKHVRYVP